MNAKHRRDNFKTWLVDKDGKTVATANAYASGVNKIQAEYHSDTNDMLNFFTSLWMTFQSWKQFLKSWKIWRKL